MLIPFYFPALNQSAARLHLQVRAHPGQGSPGEASEGCPGSESHAEGLFSFLYSLLFRPIWHIVKHVVTPSTLNLFIVCIEKSLRNFCGICSTSNNSSNVCRICVTRKHVQRQLRLSPLANLVYVRIETRKVIKFQSKFGMLSLSSEN